ncbi:MAG: TetR/AcrR family transcriptional regulator [Anaerofustis sp.]
MADRRFNKKNKNLIMQNSIKYFCEYGYTETTMRMIAQASGISTPTIFNYYKSKSEIISILLERYLNALLKITELYAAKADNAKDREKVLFFYWTAHFYFVKQDGKLFQTIESKEFSIDQTYFTTMFRDLFGWEIPEDDLENRLYSAMIVSTMRTIGDFCYSGEISIERAVFELINACYAYTRKNGLQSETEINQFVSSLNFGEFLHYSLLDDILLTNFGEEYSI